MRLRTHRRAALARRTGRMRGARLRLHHLPKAERMTAGYWFTFDRSAYDGWRDGTPFTLPDVWREVRGCAGVTIYAPCGRVVLRDAGALSARWAHINRGRNVRRGLHL